MSWVEHWVRLLLNNRARLKFKLNNHNHTTVGQWLAGGFWWNTPFLNKHLETYTLLITDRVDYPYMWATNNECWEIVRDEKSWQLAPRYRLNERDLSALLQAVKQYWTVGYMELHIVLGEHCCIIKA